MKTQLPRLGRMLAAAAVVAALAPAAAAQATSTPAQVSASIAAGTAWLQTQQQANGSLKGFDGDWAVTTLAAAGVHAADVQGGAATQTLQDFTAGAYADSTYSALPSAHVAGDLGKAILIDSSAGIHPTRVSPTVNLAASLASRWNTVNGSFAPVTPAVNSDGFALLAGPLIDLPRGVTEKLVALVRGSQHPDGGFAFTAGPNGSSDTDMTGAALAMLCQAGVPASDPQVVSGLAFLKGKQVDATGGFGAGLGTPANNTPSAAWIVIGLNACGIDPQSAAWTTSAGRTPIDFLLSQQRPDGSFRYVPTSGAVDGAHDTNDAEAGVRALSGAVFSAAPPVRADAAQPRWRSTATVADGTSVPVAVGVDDRAGDVRYCAVDVPSGAPLSSVVQTASTASTPSACATSPQVTDGTVTAVDGHAAVAGRSAWEASVDGGGWAPAQDQPVRFGGVVSLELTTFSLLGPAAGASFGSQASGTVGASVVVPFDAGTTGVRPAKVEVVGAAGDDFLVSGETCTGRTMGLDDGCAVRVRFAPSATGERDATLQVEGADGRALTDVPLAGTGGDLPTGPKGDTGDTGAKGDPGAKGDAGDAGAAGQDGADGAAGPAGSEGDVGATGATGAKGDAGATGNPGTPGAKGDAGPHGAKGEAGKAPRVAVSCRLTHHRTRITCSVKRASGRSVRLSGTAVRTATARHGAVTATLTARGRRTARHGTRLRLALRVSGGTARTVRATVSVATR